MNNQAVSKRNILAAVIGNALEWYDFLVFAFMTPIVAKLFFPSNPSNPDDSVNQILLATAVFGVGFFMRPVGGIAMNTVPKSCEFTYEFRNLPGMSPEKIQTEVEHYASYQLVPRMRLEYSEARIEIDAGPAAPFLEASEQAAITTLVRALAQDRAARKAAYGTEGGQFQAAGIPSVVCGPGHIEQAHKPDEFVEISQLQRCEDFLRKLGRSLT